MSPADDYGPSIGQRLFDAAPWLYAAIGPAGRAAKRMRDLRRGRREARAFAQALAEQPPEGLPAAGPRILLDGVCFQDPWTGIARLWGALMPLWSANGFAKQVIVLDRGRTAPRHEGFTYLDAPPVRAFDSPEQRHMLQAVCDAVSADLFVSTLYTTPASTPSLLLAYDFVPEIMDWDLREPIWRDKARAIGYATAYACSSNNTASDLHRIYPDSASRPATIASPGVDAAFCPASDERVEVFKAAYGLPDDYFVFVGHRTIHKNAELLFQAAALANDPVDFALLLVGGSPRLEQRFRSMAPRVPLRIARLTDDELRAAYTGARATLYPSHYEGFGLVVLEAMACGCPVVTCRNSSLPEAAGDAALYVGEEDAAAMLGAMRAVSDPAVRADLVAKGLDRAAEFRWERCADVVETAIRGAAS